MQSNDVVFYKEFTEMMNGRRSFGKSLNLVELPLPNLPSMGVGVPKGQMCLVKGITEPYFSKLNNESVQLVGRTSLKKRQVLSDGSFRKDKDGKYVCDSISVKQGSVAIYSKRPIGLRRFVEVDGKKKEHIVSEGFAYVDYIGDGEARRYIYIVPKSYVYKLNLCALVLTNTKLRVYYKGCKLALQNGSYVYLYVIPYKYRENMSYRVLGTKPSFNFNNEVNAILSYWMQLGVLFNLNLTKLEDNVKGITNLGLMNLEGTCVVEDYLPVGDSLLEDKEFDFDNGA